MITNNKPSVGDVIHVRITSIKEDLGAFVRMPNGYDGLIRLYDFAWFNQQNILKSFSVGDELDVKVIKELPDGKLNLSRKELQPNPKTLEAGTIVKGIVKSNETYGLIIKLGDFTALTLRQDIPSLPYAVGDEITGIVTENIFDSEKHRNKVLVSILALHEYFAKQQHDGDIVVCTYKGRHISSDNVYAVICYNDMITLSVPSKRFVEPLKSLLINNSLEVGTELNFSFSYNEIKRAIKLDMRPIEKRKKKEKEDWLHSQISRGDIVEAEVISVNDKEARIEIVNTGVEYVLPREELSPNKVVRASDEVFKGEHIKIAYLGDENGKMSFSRRFFVKDKYDSSLYDLSLRELLYTMGLKTNRFVGKLVEIKHNYFLTNLMTIGESNDEDNGKLLVDPVNGKNLIVVVDNKLRNLFIEGYYYEVEIELANKDYRIGQGTPYMFVVTSNNIKETQDPYKESVLLSFKQHTSPNTNTSVANLLEEVGKNLYSSKKRMFFELLQNADDAAAKNGVKVKLQMNGQYFVLTHDGYSFNQHDFESITSAAKSTKRANNKKTGYKGIGFKSVFTNSHSVLIKSGGYKFAFDKDCPIFKDFEKFYFLVNDIDKDTEKQAEFNHKYAKYKREFDGVKDIPWQLLPVWLDDAKLDDEISIFNKKENVSIALKMDSDTLSDYAEAIKEVFGEPRFMLFLRNTNRVQLISNNECLTIQKNMSEDGSYISLVNSYDPNNRIENYHIYSMDDILVSDQEFESAGVYIKRKDRLNNRGETENYFVRIDNAGNILGEVTGIPDRIASTKDTTISFAVKLDDSGHIVPLKCDVLSLYAYLPMNEHRFRFPFYINADFIPKSDREGIQSDNPWNHFIFFTIGKAIVRMVASHASNEEPEYLNLLPKKKIQSSSQDTAALVDAFNRGYSFALLEEQFILNDNNELVKASEIIYDESGLAEAIGETAFYQLIGTTKHLPNKRIKSDCLANSLFNIEKCTVDSVYTVLLSNITALTEWLISCTDDLRTKFYAWLILDDKTQSLIPIIPTFMYGQEWKSINSISVSENVLILTEKLAPIMEELTKLGFQMSNNMLEKHPLSAFISKQDEKEIFSKILEVDINRLTFKERLNLFVNCAELDDIGKETLRKWPIFKNQNGLYSSLSSMAAYYQGCPQWLYPHILNVNEYNNLLDSYLIPKNEIYSSIIEKYIDSIIVNVDILHVYNAFVNSWRSGFTTTLFAKQSISKLSILAIVEQSDDATKASYIRTFRQFPLSSSADYLSSSFEYRWIKLASLNEETITYARSIVTINGKSLSTYTIKDELNVVINNIQYKFSLSKLLPTFASSSVLSNVVSKFSAIPRINDIFAQSEARPVDVRNQLYNELRMKTSLISEDQFCFLMVFRKSLGFQSFDNSLIPIVRVNDVSLFLRILDRTFEMGLAETLGGFVRNGGVVYPFPNLIGTYFNSDNYTLPQERVPAIIANWANTPEKKRFLIQLGLHDDQSKEILRRKSFKEKKTENVWNINDLNIIRNFLKWVSGSFTLPITDDVQVGILEPLFNTLRITGIYNEQDFTSATEWTNELYFDWKNTKDLKIYILDGKLPYRGMFNNTYLFKGYSGESAYFPNTKTIYISSNREPAALLADIYSNSSLRCPFTKDDWNAIFLVSADVVQEKDKRIAELERMLEEAKNSNGADRSDSKFGKAADRGNLDEPSRIELNREARLAAKDYLDSLTDYDCSEWNATIGNGLVKDTIKYKGQYITVVITSSIGRKLYLHPRLFAELMINPNNLLLNYGYDRRIHRISFEETFKANEDVNLIFDTNVITPSEFAYLANRYMHSKKTCFVIENINYSISDQIKGFGLSEKKNDADVYTDISADDLFDF